jgi:hypothetical protein
MLIVVNVVHSSSHTCSLHSCVACPLLDSRDLDFDSIDSVLA